MSEEVSTLPTLLRRGYIVPPKGSTDRVIKSIKNTISVDYLLHFLSDKIPEEGTNYVRQPPKTYGGKVLLLKSETGSGKSTVLPVKLYTTFFHRTKRSIICTQPRVVTALDIPNSMLEHNKELKMGINIGYSTQLFKLIPSENGILFSTVGILLEELKNIKEPIDFIKKYQFIIIDEVHSRDLEMDSTLFLLKKFLQDNFKNPMCPFLIFMSATFDEEVFIRYFEIPESNYIQVKGSTFPIEAHFSDYSISNYVDYTISKAQKLHLDNFADIDNNESSRDIIIFVRDSGIGKKIGNALHLFNSNILDNPDNITKYVKNLDIDLDAFLKRGGKDKDDEKKYILPLVLDSANFNQGGLEYQNLFSNLNIIQVPIWKVSKVDGKSIIDTESEPYKYVMPSRRIIIATDVAETGITINTLKYCIDTGYRLSSEFFPEYGCKSLINKNVSHSSAMQRRGRVGRKAMGYWYTCYTKETFDMLNPEQISSIISGDTTETLLTILIKEKKVDVIQEHNLVRIKNNKKEDNIFQMHLSVSNNWFTVKNESNVDIPLLDFIELPSIQMLEYSVEKLHVLGFLDSDYNITATGYYANKFRFIGLELRKMILSGFNYGADILSLITITSFVYVSKKKVFEKGFTLTNFFNKISDTEFKFYNNILIADDFINCLFIFNIITDFIEKNLTLGKIGVEHIKKWCKENFIKFNGLCDVLSTRDNMIETMVENGFNVHYNGLSLNKYNLNNIIKNSLAEGLIEIKKIKLCLYEGFKLNMLTHNNFSLYKSVYKNISVKVKSSVVKPLNPDLVDQEYPRFLVCDSVALNQKFGSAQFEFIADGFISVLDNFIDPDLGFFIF